MLLEEFPYLYLTTETLHRLWRQSSHQVEQLSKAEQDIKHRKSLAQGHVRLAQNVRFSTCFKLTAVACVL